jgi:addiction module HigA family antidote
LASAEWEFADGKETSAVPRTRIERIAREEKPVTADTALRLGKSFKTGGAFWMDIQARFDLETAEDVLAPQKATASG